MALARQILYNYRMNRIDMFLLSQLDMYQKFSKTTLGIINKLPTLNKNNADYFARVNPQFIHFKPTNYTSNHDS